MTLGQWAETWWQGIDVGENTEAFYRSLLTCHILPRWGGELLTALTPSHIRAWLKHLRTRHAEATVTSIRKLLALILADAVDEGLLTRTPVRPERGRRGRLRPRTERAWIDEHQLLQLAGRAAMLATPQQALLLITAAYTGMRWGELAGLHRDNLDLTTGRAHITPTGALHEVNGTLSLGHPKTRASVRTVTLPPFLTALLSTHLKTSTRELVFTTVRGRPLRRSGFQRRIFAPAARGTTHQGQHWPPIEERLTFHGLRHSHKTWLIEDGIPDIAQARRLGHTLQDKMDDTYAHVAPSIETRLLAGLEARWQRSLNTLAPTSHPRASLFLPPAAAS
ncbi:site-specific integrase [Streptomyces sp. B15]|uniref:tyrosine-type recombinase/integrase n=1 Tax=Streptomyces sp. B15 TaxID=1537797 RepID=UPI001B36B286|nr:site-specific integrase [Streptomyces sp. B15]MBQ1123749.1 site-specific integrase [Streptomyces sp. B15]